MSPNTANIDLVLQYALLLAGEEDDFFERDLGPIHLIKYVYIADLAHARAEQGKTFTDTHWTFYKFGPWSQAVNERIEPALKAIHAEKKAFSSDYGDRSDWVRWSKTDESLLDQLGRSLPLLVKLELKKCVHRYKKDTPALLDFVYRSIPMLNAAPGEVLDFSKESEAQLEKRRKPDQEEELTDKKRKQIREGLRHIRERGGKTAPTANLVQPATPRYDETFEQGVEWLDTLTGPRFSESELTVEFSDDVWKSTTRKGPDVP